LTPPEAGRDCWYEHANLDDFYLLGRSWRSRASTSG
jgi:hypothetical protein